VLRIASVAIVCVLAASAAPRAAEPPTFNGMPWGATRAQVLEAAAASGLRVVGTHGNDVELAGEPFGSAATVNLLLSPTAGLVKVQVRYPASERPARTYASVIERLTVLYGPTEPVEMFKRPFVRGDGREDEALLAGKGMIIAAWGDERVPGQAAVILQTSGPAVALDFESHAWKAESVRRKRESRESWNSGPALAALQPPAFAAAPSAGN
jgi:hypothetical protein